MCTLASALGCSQDLLYLVAVLVPIVATVGHQRYHTGLDQCEGLI